MTKPFGIISDTHNHAWSQFASEDADGVNSRLRIILDETFRAAQAVKDAGGNRLYHGGDMFHVRGSIATSVLIPTITTYKRIIEELGVQIVAIPGNHDMEQDDSVFEGNASNALADAGVTVLNNPGLVGHQGSQDVLMLPWFSTNDALRVNLERWAQSQDVSETNVIIHAPVNGVIMGIPDHGLDATELAAYGFKRVFSGHYHNHKDFGNGVYSIGALTHQTWGDVGSEAGFVIVHEDRVEHFESQAPKFVELDAATDKATLGAAITGNYIKMKLKVIKESQIAEMRKFLMDAGAAGVVIHPVRDNTATERTGATVKSGASMEVSVAEFVKIKKYRNAEAVGNECHSVLKEIAEVA